MVNRATEEIDMEVKVTEIGEKNKKYGIKNFPALIINNDIVSEGKVLTSREIKRLILSY